MISQYLIPGIVAGAVTLALLCILLMWLGATIEHMPTKKEGKVKTITRPEPFTKIFSFVCVIGYVVFAGISTAEDRVFAIVGIAGLIAMFMFMATAVVFSAIVWSRIQKLQSTNPYHERMYEEFKKLQSESGPAIIMNGDCIDGIHNK